VESEHASDLSAQVQGGLTDTGLWLYRVFSAPGDYLVATLNTHAPRIAELVGIDAAADGGMLSGFVSAFLWLLTLVAIIMMWRLILDIYWTVVVFAKHLTEGVQRTGRVVSTRVGIAFRSYDLKRQARLAKTDVSDQGDLTALELQVLRTHSKLPPGHIVTARSIARVLRERPAQVQKALDKLKTLSLVDDARGADKGEDGYRLTQFGAVFLSSHMRAERSQVESSPAKA
jgi:DNA-binding MarR family transcriptional regulator